MITKKEHEIAYQDICALVNKHAGKLSSLEMLAIAANMIGKLIALQDQRTVTGTMALEVVAKNLEIGNAQALEKISNTQGNG